MTDTKVVLRVVTILGVLGGLLAVGLLVLSHEVIQQGAGAKSIDPAAVALAGAIGSAFTGVAGFIGGLLSSTRSGDVEGMERAKLLAELEQLKHAKDVSDVVPDPKSPIDVRVANSEQEPVPVDDTPP